MEEIQVSQATEAPIETQNAPSEIQEGNEPKNQPDPQVDENPYKGTKHKYKAKGKEIEVDYDTLLSKAALVDGANLTFQEAKQLKKEVEEKLSKLSDQSIDNFEDIIDLIGVEKALKFASTIQEKHSYWEQLSDEQREDILYRHEAELAKQELESLKGKEKKQAEAEASRQAYDAINQEIGDALAEAKANGVPLADLPDIALGIVDEMLMVLEQIEAEEKAGRKWSGKAPTAKDVVKKLQGQYEERSASYLKKLNAKQLKSMLSPEQLAELRQEEIDSLYAGTNQNRVGQRENERVRRDDSQIKNQSVPIRGRSNDIFADLDKKYGVTR